MKKELREKWIQALRSGNYIQGLEYLEKASVNKDEGMKYCCLGVLCHVIEKDIDTARRDGGDIELLNDETLEEVGLTHVQQELFSYMNDGNSGHKKRTFIEIADYILENL